jgi:hypothetical protein
MVVGYSTHGCWAPLSELKEIEVQDRGNQWFEDNHIDLDSMEGIWVTLEPPKAIPYLFPGEEFESQDYQEALKNPEAHLFQVDLTGAISVLEDGDGGVLYIRKRRGKETNRSKHQS